jgi:hypothetical protein
MKTFAKCTLVVATMVAFSMQASLSSAFVVPSVVVVSTTRSSTSSKAATNLSMAKYKTMDEILALFPDDKAVLVNFYDSSTENDIKADIMRAKQLLADRATLVSIKRQDYPELSKLWDADTKSPAMILFRGKCERGICFGCYCMAIYRLSHM